MMKMNIKQNFFRFSGLTFCLILFSLSQEVNSEETTINVGSLCDRFNGTVDLRDQNHAILIYKEILPRECKILLANTTTQHVVFSFYYWDVKGNDTLVIRDHYTELSLTDRFSWYGNKTVIFRGPTTIDFSLKDKFFSTRMNGFRFLYTVTYSGIRNCEKSSFVCNNKICLKEHQLVCDGNNNCGDWSDEINCERGCTEHEFKCANNKCIPKYQLCNGRNECGDMSDEEMCNSNCRLGYQYKCNNTICISSDEVCDNKNDCGDWSDEINCHRECYSLRFPCRNRKCIVNSKVCNGVDDCGDNSDERNCSTAKTHNEDESKIKVVKFINPWIITTIICGVVLAIVIITLLAIFLRNKMKNKKEPPATQPAYVPTTTSGHNPQPSNMFGRVRQFFRSERQAAPSTVRPPFNNEPTSVASGSQTYRVPSMYPPLQSGVDNPELRAEV